MYKAFLKTAVNFRGYRKHRGWKSMLNDTMGMQSAKSRLWETLPDEWPAFFKSKLQRKKKESEMVGEP